MGPEIRNPSPLHIKSPRPGPRRPSAKKRLTSSTSERLKKGKTQYKSSTKEKAANTIMWSPAPDKPILLTMLYSFCNYPQPPWIWTNRTYLHPRKKSWHVDTEKEVKISIKEREKARKKGALQKGERKWSHTPRTWSKDLNSANCIQTSIKTMINPLPGDQGLAFHSPALQTVLFGPLLTSPRLCVGRY